MAISTADQGGLVQKTVINHVCVARPLMWLLTAAVLLGVGCGVAKAAQDSSLLLNQARSQLQAGQGAKAYESLFPMMLKRAGEPEFDLVLGQAALATDRPTEAIFAFERCLAVQPLQSACRQGMIAARRKLGELDPARGARQDAGFGLWFEAGLGYDTNANTATADDRIWLPSYGIVLLTPEGQRTDSFFHDTKLGLEYSRSLSARWRFTAQATVQSKQYWSLHRYDALVVNTRLGLQYNHGQHQLSLRAMGQYYRLGGSSYRNLGGLWGQYSYMVTDRTRLGGYVQYMRLAYPGAHQQRDAGRTTVGLSWSQQLSGGRAIAFSSLYTGREARIHGDVAGSRLSAIQNYDFVGLRLGTVVMLNARTRINAGVGTEQRRYDGLDALFKAARRDRQYDAWLGLTYDVSKRLSLRPTYRYTRASSSIVLRDYRRHVFSINLRYELF